MSVGVCGRSDRDTLRGSLPIQHDEIMFKSEPPQYKTIAILLNVVAKALNMRWSEFRSKMWGKIPKYRQHRSPRHLLREPSKVMVEPFHDFNRVLRTRS